MANFHAFADVPRSLSDPFSLSLSLSLFLSLSEKSDDCVGCSSTILFRNFENFAFQDYGSSSFQRMLLKQ